MVSDFLGFALMVGKPQAIPLHRRQRVVQHLVHRLLAMLHQHLCRQSQRNVLVECIKSGLLTTGLRLGPLEVHMTGAHHGLAR